VHPYEVIKKKRDGGALSADEIRDFIAGYTRGGIPDYQMAALCMAVFFRSLSPAELAAWTEAMLHSGDILDLSDIPGPKVDKHSTGGVGDKVSLALAPLAAACGVKVPMISGRGLGHTGGTLDKLESIPGFRVDLSTDDFRRIVRDVGACLIGQTARLAPADKKLYALRDVTATVDCIPLIASSIMSKKLAEGIDALVLDVKVGSGAFMRDLERARELARTLIQIGRGMGKRVTAVITDMDQPLGRAVGNALEVAEALDVLEGKGPADLTEVTLVLTAEMLVLAGTARSTVDARALVERAVADRSGLKKMADIVRAHGGNPDAVTNRSLLPQARTQVPVPTAASGFVTGIDAEQIGLAALALGAGREKTDSSIDPAVGVVLDRKVGDAVKTGDRLATVHANDASRITEAVQRVATTYQIAAQPPARRPLIVERLDAA
jgi:pyrimidine-nucleoside phosphorylase